MDLIHYFADLPHLWLRVTLVGLFLFLFLRWRARSGAAFVGNSRSGIYHWPDCVYGRETGYPRFLKDPETAVTKGYRRCTVCNPPAPGETRREPPDLKHGLKGHPSTRSEFKGSDRKVGNWGGD